jgi:hypothetical protein
MEHCIVTTKNFIITSLQRNITKEELFGFMLYLFGSLSRANSFNDIDLLIVYNENLISIESAILFRNKVFHCLKKDCNTIIDICLLSKGEDNQTRFSEKENAIEFTLR